jgi:hypothetical protein
LLFDETGNALPDNLRKQVVRIDPDAPVKRKWESVIEASTTSPNAYDVIVDSFTDSATAIQRLNSIWKMRVRSNYAVRPAYFGISTISQRPLVRFDIERLGGHFLHLYDVPAHFEQELEQIRLAFAPLGRSLPRWLIVQEGNGPTLHAVVYLMGHQGRIRVGGSDRHNAALAALIKRNGIARSLGAWQKVLADDSLFKPGGGSFDVPSLSCLKIYLRRDFLKYLQEAFDQQRSGYRASRVIEHMHPGTWAAEYRIRGEWEVIRR